MHGLALFVGFAVVVTLTPGPTTAMVIRSALRGGRRAALLTTLGNAIGIFFWGAASALGVSALIQASEVAFLVLKVAGAVMLVWLGIRSFRRPSRPVVEAWSPGAFRDGLVTCLANPKAAVFFVALFPQFLERGHANVLPGFAMAGLVVALDLVWYSILALAVTRMRRWLVEGRRQARIERVTGSLMVGLGVRLALESR